MTGHIGIVACSAEGAALCYTTICIEGEEILGKHNHPEVSMHTHPLGEYMDYIYNNRWEGVAQLMLSSAHKLADIGADFVICPDNTIHAIFDDVVKISPIPWLHIGEEVAKEAKARNYRRLGILGTKYLHEMDVYPDILESFNLEFVKPENRDIEKVNDIIFNELVYGRIKHDSQQYFIDLVSKMADQGCDAVVMGCTEIPLILNDDVSSLPLLDSTRLLARAALKRATAEEETAIPGT